MARSATLDLLNTYYGRVLGVAYQVVGDAALAAQVVETTFDRLAGDEAVDDLVVWQTAVDVLRTYILRGFTVTPLASEAAGWQAALIDGLARLDPEARIVLLLRYHENLSYEDLGEVLESDPRRVREELARARAALMNVVGPQHALR